MVVGTIFGAGYLIGGRKTAEAVSSRFVGEQVFDLKLPAEQEKSLATVTKVQAKISQIGELTTCEGRYEVTKGREFTRYLFENVPIFGTTNAVELSCSGIVKAGYDLDKITVSIDEGSKTIFITLPDMQINSNEILWDETMICREKNNLFNPIDFEQYQVLIPEIKALGLQQAVDKGLPQTVEANAKQIITNYLGCFVDYTVSFP